MKIYMRHFFCEKKKNCGRRMPADSNVEFLTVLDGSLFLANSRKKARSGEFIYFATNEEFQYNPLCDDFGPMNISSVIRFVELLEWKRASEPSKKIVYLVERGRRPFTNGAFLIGAYLILKLDFEPEVVVKKFDGIDPHMLEPFRDASFAPVEFGLSLLDCFRAVRKAKTLGWLRPPTSRGIWGKINVGEYDHYEDPLNGDLVQVRYQCYSAQLVIFGLIKSGRVRRSYQASSSHSRDLWTSAASPTATTAGTASSARPTTCRSSPTLASQLWCDRWKPHNLFYRDRSIRFSPHG